VRFSLIHDQHNNIITYTKQISHGHGVTSQLEAVVEDGLFLEQPQRDIPPKSFLLSENRGSGSIGGGAPCTQSNEGAH
jgi:hypothetical protein